MAKQISLTTEGNRKYLDGIAFLDWYTGENCEFVSAMVRMLAPAGEEVPYHYLMGVTGAAFRFSIGTELWNPGFYSFELVAPDMCDLVRRAFAAVGHAYDWLPQGEREGDTRRIIETIDGGLGVMLRGHVIDASDWTLILGYEGEGEVLIGSNPFDNGERFHGYSIIPDWHEKTREYITLGARCAPRDPATVYVESLQQAVNLVRTPQVAERYTGLRAYEAMASALRDEAFPTTAEEATRGEDTPWGRYLCILCYDMMLDDRRSAIPFLRDAASLLPAASDELLRAAECYETTVKLREGLDDIMRGDFSEEAQARVTDPAVREAYARVILQIRDSDARGIAHIENGLDALGVDAMSGA